MTTPSPLSPPQFPSSNKLSKVASDSAPSNRAKFDANKQGGAGKKKATLVEKIHAKISKAKLSICAALSNNRRKKSASTSAVTNVISQPNTYISGTLLASVGNQSTLVNQTPQVDEDKILTLKHAWIALKFATKTAEMLANGVPFTGVITAFNKLVEAGEIIIDNKRAVAMLLEPYTDRLSILHNALESSSGVDNMASSFKHLEKDLGATCKELEKMSQAPLGSQILDKDEIKKKVEDIFKQLNLTTENFQLELALANFRKTTRVEAQLDHE
ncbi:WD40 repeat-like protein [Mycena chlorophos]|uniref:WD40 repeat-like protein n=1 Tax=Mycena chlorophos TaxID=658473 RepID=A0A8H6WKA7_MYCCL|nr:WD40 repeat-like protein [Mycena chlorophos]